MNCQSVLNVEDLYAEDRLNPSRRAEVEAHLESCAACRGRLKAKPLAAAFAEGPAPASLKDRLKNNLKSLDALRAEAAPEPAPAMLSPHGDVWPVLVSAAIYTALAVLLAWFGPGMRSQAYDTLPSGYGRMSP